MLSNKLLDIDLRYFCQASLPLSFSTHIFSIVFDVDTLSLDGWSKLIFSPSVHVPGMDSRFARVSCEIANEDGTRNKSALRAHASRYVAIIYFWWVDPKG